MNEPMLSEKERRFVELYRTLNDAETAAEQAGYCRSSAARLLARPQIAEALKVDGAEMSVASPDEVLSYLTDVLRGEKGGGSAASMKAAELLGKRMGLFTEAAADDLPPPTIIDDIRVPPGAPPRTTAGEERRG